MTCQRCNGDGVIEVNRFVGEEGMKIEMDVMAECPECEGEGVVEDDDEELNKAKEESDRDDLPEIFTLKNTNDE